MATPKSPSPTPSPSPPVPLTAAQASDVAQKAKTTPPPVGTLDQWVTQYNSTFVNTVTQQIRSAAAQGANHTVVDLQWDDTLYAHALPQINAWFISFWKKHGYNVLSVKAVSMGSNHRFSFSWNK